MKNLLLIFSVFILFSCAAGPKPDSTSAASGLTQPNKTNNEETVFEQPVEEKPAQPPEPEILAVEPAPQEEPVIISILDEPVIELPETRVMVLPPDETQVIAMLPEPDLPVLPPVLPTPPQPAVPQPQVPQPAPVSPPAVPAPSPPALSPPAPAPVQPPVPAPRRTDAPPPAFLGPAEERPPVIARESVPSVNEPPAPLFPVPEAGPRISEDGEINFSRTVRATVGQIVEIPFRGTGWVYLGELASRRGIVYDARRLDSEGQSFLFRTDAEGTYALKFYKQDFIRDFILNDYVQVIVGEAPIVSGSGWFNPPRDRGRVIAEPRWPTSIEEAQLRHDGAAGLSAAVPGVDTHQITALPETPAPSGRAVPAADVAGSSTVPAAAAPAAAAPQAAADNAGALVETPADLPPGSFLQKAKETFDEGRVASAIAILDQFRELYPSGSDEAYWLYGQFYEANSPSRDILLSLDYYRRLVREYPQSSRYNDARRRIAYLERYYINIQ